YALSYLPFAQRDCTSSSQTRRLGCSVFVSTAAACTEIYTLSLHDALPIYIGNQRYHEADCDQREYGAKNSSHNVHPGGPFLEIPDRKSTRLNSSHVKISYAVFCLKKKNNGTQEQPTRAPAPRPDPLTSSAP